MSGIGAEVAKGLAGRGAQLVLLTQHALTDPFLVDYIEDLRTQTNNELITAEQVDLASLHSIRNFATKWIDNLPPR
jgi:NAD(P)-dependent dehydrogenase (short-subunit alcohol dehydrogenase family)